MVSIWWHFQRLMSSNLNWPIKEIITCMMMTNKDKIFCMICHEKILLLTLTFNFSRRSPKGYWSRLLNKLHQVRWNITGEKHAFYKYTDLSSAGIKRKHLTERYFWNRTESKAGYAKERSYSINLQHRQKGFLR